MDTTPTAVETEFQLSYLERLRAAWSVSASSWSMLLWMLLLPFWAAILLLWVATHGSSHPLRDGVMFGLLAGLVPGMLLLKTSIAHRAGRRRGPIAYRFDREGLQAKTATTLLQQRWPAIVRVREGSGMLLLYLDRRSAHCVPVRALPHRDAAARIARWASEGGAARVELPRG